MQRRRLSRGRTRDPGEAQGQPGGCRGHTEAAQDGGADQERTGRSVLRGGGEVGGVGGGVLTCDGQHGYGSTLVFYHIIPAVAFFLFFLCLCFWIPLSLCYEPSHIQIRLKSLFSRRPDRQRQLFGPIVRQRPHIYHNVTDKALANGAFFAK